MEPDSLEASGDATHTLSAVRRAVLAAVRWGYAPVMIAIAISAVIAIGRGAGRGWPLAALIAAITVSFIAERVLPYHRAWNLDRGDRRRDVVHALVNEGLLVANVALLPVLVRHLPWPALWPTAWPFAAQVVIAILVADLGITLTHMASHRWSTLWRLHAVHHSVERMYGLNGLMKHPLHQLLETGVGVLPLVLLAVPSSVATALAVCVAVQLLMQHSNCDYRAPGLHQVFAWNRLHRLHHVRGPEGNVNFGLFTTALDRLAGTAALPSASRFPEDGVGLDTGPYPRAWRRQLIEPFRPARARTDP